MIWGTGGGGGQRYHDTTASKYLRGGVGYDESKQIHLGSFGDPSSVNRNMWGQIQGINACPYSPLKKSKIDFIFLNIFIQVHLGHRIFNVLPTYV